jgi:hypothetical protein
MLLKRRRVYSPGSPYATCSPLPRALASETPSPGSQQRRQSHLAVPYYGLLPLKSTTSIPLLAAFSLAVSSLGSTESTQFSILYHPFPFTALLPTWTSSPQTSNSRNICNSPTNVALPLKPLIGIDCLCLCE